LKTNALASSNAPSDRLPKLQTLHGAMQEFGLKMMSEKSKPRSKAVLQKDLLIRQGLRLANIFIKLQDTRDRQKIITLAERLLDEQNAN
jgi:hypothetical protein